MGDVDMVECALSNIESMTHSTPVQRQIEESIYQVLQPFNKQDKTIEFYIKDDQYYIELNKTEVEVTFKIVKEDGSNLEATDKVGAINYLGATLFENVEIKLNGEQISQGSTSYAERAIMEVLMSYGEDAAKGWLRAGLFEKDTAGKMDIADPEAADGNAGLKSRADLTKLSKAVTVRAKLHGDIFNQPRPLPSGNRLDIKFSRNPDSFCLMTAEADKKYKIIIEDMALHFLKIRVSKSVQQLNAGRELIFPIDRVEQNYFNVPKEGKKINLNHLHEGEIPTRLVFGFVDSTAHTGEYNLNPFNWVHANLRRVTLLRDDQIVDSRGINVNFTTGDIMAGFWNLYRATNMRYANAGMLINMDDYKKGGYALWAFDLSPSQCDEQFNDPTRRGKLSLELEFEKERDNALGLCAYLQFNSEIVLNKAKQAVKIF